MKCFLSILHAHTRILDCPPLRRPDCLGDNFRTCDLSLMIFLSQWYSDALVIYLRASLLLKDHDEFDGRTLVDFGHSELEKFILSVCGSGFGGKCMPPMTKRGSQALGPTDGSSHCNSYRKNRNRQTC